MDPLLIDVPEQVLTDRLILRCPRPGDGPVLNAAVRESLDELKPWMTWAQEPLSIEQSETNVRRAQAKFRLREELFMMILERLSGDVEGEVLGCTGLHRINWEVRSFEIGYWRRTGRGGQGLVTEAVRGLARMAFDQLQARRVELRMDDLNAASWRVAERAGFTFEGVLRCDSLTPSGESRDTRVYSRVRGVEEPQA